jgi:hypothetical protein
MVIRKPKEAPMNDLFDILAAQDDTVVLCAGIHATNEDDGTEHFVAFPIKDVVFKPPVNDEEVVAMARKALAGGTRPVEVYVIPLAWVTAAGLLHMDSFALGAEMQARGCEPVAHCGPSRKERRSRRRA